MNVKSECQKSGETDTENINTVMFCECLGEKCVFPILFKYLLLNADPAVFKGLMVATDTLLMFWTFSKDSGG